MDAKVPFLCGNQTLESWNFKIDGQEKILEIQMKTGEDMGKKLIKWKIPLQDIKVLFSKQR